VCRLRRLRTKRNIATVQVAPFPAFVREFNFCNIETGFKFGFGSSLHGLQKFNSCTAGISGIADKFIEDVLGTFGTRMHIGVCKE